MLSIPLYIFLFIYFFFLLGWAVFFYVNVSHLWHTGTLTFASLAMTVFFIVFSAIILWVTWYLLRGVDWREAFTIGGSLMGGTTFGEF